jgi:penicillin-insensitive murein endopeptidase
MNLLPLLIVAAVVFSSRGLAQDITLSPQAPVPGYARDDLNAPAKELFGRIATPAGNSKAARSLGFYSRGCLSGAVALPFNGPGWQVMRLSRNRNWGNPALVQTLMNFAARVPKISSWPGILTGDMSQPRGGPMLTGHASHQIGLDADIWLTPMPGHVLSPEERENMMAINVVADNWNDVNPAVWTQDHLNVIKLAAQTPGVERILVNPAIKKALCREARGDRSWLSTVRPALGHNYHFHIRLKCPPHGAKGCVPQAPPPKDEGCGETLAWWFSEEARKPKPPGPSVPPLTLGQLSAACQAVIAAP